MTFFLKAHIRIISSCEFNSITRMHPMHTSSHFGAEPLDRWYQSAHSHLYSGLSISVEAETTSPLNLGLFSAP